MFFTRDKSFYKTLVTLAIPIALQNAVTFAVGLADNVMIGTLGDSAISGVYVGSQLQTLLQMFIGGIEGAILILAAQYWGKRDTKSIRRIAAIGVRFALLIGLVITVTAFLLPSQIVSLFTSDASVIESGTVYVRVVSLSYIFFCISQVMVATMRAVETAKIGLYVSFVTLIVNVICNYILIFGKLGFPALGVTGAAVATLFSRIIEAAVMVIYVRCVDKKLKLRFADLLKRGGELTRDFLRYGLPIMGGQVVWSVNMLGQTMILGRYDAGVIEAAVMVVYVRCVDKKLKLRFADLLKRGGELTRDFLRYGLPIMGGQVVWSVNMLGQTMILGRYDAGVIAAVSIANMLHNMMYIAMNGLSSAVGIITGKTVGSGRMEKIREYARTTQVIFLGLGILSGIAVHFLRDPFIGLYGASDAAVAYAREFINVISVTIIGTCYQAACLFGLVKSGGDISFVFRNDTIFVFLVVLPSAIIASYLGAPPWVVFACLKCDQILKCFVAVVKINRYNWMKNLTRETNEV